MSREILEPAHCQAQLSQPEVVTHRFEGARLGARSMPGCHLLHALAHGAKLKPDEAWNGIWVQASGKVQA
jgi:hypothetical protein